MTCMQDMLLNKCMRLQNIREIIFQNPIRSRPWYIQLSYLYQDFDDLIKFKSQFAIWDRTWEDFRQAWNNLCGIEKQMLSWRLTIANSYKTIPHHICIANGFHFIHVRKFLNARIEQPIQSVEERHDFLLIKNWWEKTKFDFNSRKWWNVTNHRRWIGWDVREAHDVGEEYCDAFKTLSNNLSKGTKEPSTTWNFQTRYIDCTILKFRKQMRERNSPLKLLINLNIQSRISISRIISSLHNQMTIMQSGYLTLLLQLLNDWRRKHLPQ